MATLPTYEHHVRVLNAEIAERTMNNDPITQLHGDCREILKTLPNQSAQCVVTSPPYFGLRDYGVDGQIGLEDSPAEYVAALVGVFQEVRRVLKDDGTLWLNLGDSYANDTKWGGTTSGKHIGRLHNDAGIGRRRHMTGLPSKSLIGIPWRVAFALQDIGWVLRSEIIWHKPNAMPESVTDRPTRSHEHLFLFSKQPQYYYDADAIAEHAVNGDPASPRGSTASLSNREAKPNSGRRDKQGESGLRRYEGFSARWDASEPRTTRNKRDVWSINTRPYGDAHFAVMPEALVEPCILAGTKEGDTVLDPFCGSGTVLRVALKWRRRGVGIDLNQAYLELQNKRTNGVQVALL